MDYTLNPIAHISNDYTDKFGIPRQSCLEDGTVSTIIFEKEYRDENALRGLSDYDRVWLIWLFENGKDDDGSFRATVRPPRLGGNKRVGVFATRSPYHPNRLGLSCVKLLGIEKTQNNGIVLKVSGADLMNGTKIFDIKPYLPFSDSFPDAKGGFAERVFENDIEVVFSLNAKASLCDNELIKIRDILKQNPKPAYHNNPGRIYSMDYGKYTVRFTADGEKCTVTEIIQRQEFK